MRRITHMVSAGLALIVLLTGACGWGAAAGQTNPAPADLLNETYNPFFHTELPDGYQLLQAGYDLVSRTYTLVLSAADTAETVVPVMLDAMGSDDADSIALCTAFLRQSGAAGVETDAGTGCEINDFGGDGFYNVKLYQTMENSEAYDALIAANFNLAALGAVADGFDFQAPAQANLTLHIEGGLAVLTREYAVPDAKAVKAELTAAYPDLYVKTGDRLMLRYGDMYTDVLFSAVNDGLITLEQTMDAADICFGDYVPPVSLRNFGFDDFREESAKCTYRDPANGVWLMISRPEWGENEHPSEVNALVFSIDKDPVAWTVFYHPGDGAYQIMLDYGDKHAEYAVRRIADAYTYFTEGDWQHTKGIAALVFPESKRVLREALAALDGYIAETFGMDADALFALDYE